jgi:hypothetical protein
LFLLELKISHGILPGHTLITKTKVIELVEGLEEVNLGGFIGMSIYAIPGQPMGVMKGTGMERSPSGNIVVDANGVPVASTEDQVFGNVQG